MIFVNGVDPDLMVSTEASDQMYTATQCISRNKSPIVILANSVDPDLMVSEEAI